MCFAVEPENAQFLNHISKHGFEHITEAKAILAHQELPAYRELYMDESEP